MPNKIIREAQFSHLKPKIVWTGKRYIIVRNKNASKRICGKARTFEAAVKQAVYIFHTRIIGRALRYEHLRRMGIKEAQ